LYDYLKIDFVLFFNSPVLILYIHLQRQNISNQLKWTYCWNDDTSTQMGHRIQVG